MAVHAELQIRINYCTIKSGCIIYSLGLDCAVSAVSLSVGEEDGGDICVCVCVCVCVCGEGEKSRGNEMPPPSSTVDDIT